MYTLQYPNGSGDGTVPVSSATALDVRVSGFDDVESDTDAFGVDLDGDCDVNESTTTLSISTEDGESWFKIGHEPIYKTNTAQKISFSAIENFCLVKIQEVTGYG